MSVVDRVRALPPEMQMAGGAAAALAVSLILPWYEKSFVPQGTRAFVQQNLSAFGVFSFVEAAVLLVAAGVLYLVWARSEQKAFHLPGGDGFVITLAGCWALALLVWRLFDKPDVDDPGATVGIQWGIFGALLAAGALIAAGARVRAAHRPEPPNPVAEEPPEPEPEQRRPRDRTAATKVLGEQPAWEGEPPPAPERAKPAAPPRDEPDEPPDDAPPTARRRRRDDEPDRLF
jgi:hypothetical protein